MNEGRGGGPSTSPTCLTVNCEKRGEANNHGGGGKGEICVGSDSYSAVGCGADQLAHLCTVAMHPQVQVLLTTDLPDNDEMPWHVQDYKACGHRKWYPLHIPPQVSV